MKRIEVITNPQLEEKLKPNRVLLHVLLNLGGTRTPRAERRVGDFIVPHQLLVSGQDVRHNFGRLHEDLHTRSPRVQVEDAILGQLRETQVQIDGGPDFLWTTTNKTNRKCLTS